MKKKILLATPMLIATALTACGNTPSSSTDPGNYLIKEDITIEFWHTSSNDSLFNQAINSLKEIEPHITVKPVKYSSSYDALKNTIIDGLSAGNFPDLYLCYPDSICEIMYNPGFAISMDNYMSNKDYGWKQEEDIDDIVEAFLEEGKTYPLSGTYSLPYAKSSEVMFYNTDILGLDLTEYDGPVVTEDYVKTLTWEKLFDEFCPAFMAWNDAQSEDDKILKKDSTKGYESVLSVDSSDNLVITMAEQYGYAYTALDKATGAGQLLFNNTDIHNLGVKLNEYANKHYITTPEAYSALYGSDYFKSQNCIFCIGSTAGVKNQVATAFDAGVAPVPYAEGKARKVINQGPSFGFLKHNSDPRKDDRILASWLFYKEFANVENSTYYAINSGYLPVRYSSYESTEYKAAASTAGKRECTLDKLKALVYTHCSTISNQLFVSPVFKGSATSREELGNAFVEILKVDSTLTLQQIQTLIATAETNTKKKM